MARLFARAVVDPSLRHQIHDGVARRFDGDTNVLFSQLSNSSDVRSTLVAKYRQRHGVRRSDALDAIHHLADRIPRFQVAVPARFDDWDPESFTPLVGYTPEGVEDTDLKMITAYDAEGRVHLLDAQVMPDQPVIILGVNERTDDAGKILTKNSVSEDTLSLDATTAGGRYFAELKLVSLHNDHEPWSRGAAEISYVAQSRGCQGVNHTDRNVTGLDYAGDVRQWTYGDGLDLGWTGCDVIFYWWEDDVSNWDFTLGFKGFSLGVGMGNGDDLIGGHQHDESYFKDGSGPFKCYAGLDDLSYCTE